MLILRNEMVNIKKLEIGLCFWKKQVEEWKLKNLEVSVQFEKCDYCSGQDCERECYTAPRKYLVENVK